MCVRDENHIAKLIRASVDNVSLVMMNSALYLVRRTSQFSCVSRLGLRNLIGSSNGLSANRTNDRLNIIYHVRWVTNLKYWKQTVRDFSVASHPKPLGIISLLHVVWLFREL